MLVLMLFDIYVWGHDKMHLKFGRAISVFLCLALGGFLSGTVNGVFGTGGGILAVFVLSRLLAGSNEYEKKDIFAMTLFSCFFMSLSSAVIYAHAGHAEPSDALPYLLPALLGGTAGAFLLDKIKPALLSKIFALLVIYAGVTLFTR